MAERPTKGDMVTFIGYTVNRPSTNFTVGKLYEVLQDDGDGDDLPFLLRDDRGNTYWNAENEVRLFREPPPAFASIEEADAWLEAHDG